MELKKLEHYLTVCKVPDVTDIDMTSEFYFVGKTDEEISLVCKTEDTPTNAIEKDDGWKGSRIKWIYIYIKIQEENYRKQGIAEKFLNVPLHGSG